MEVFDQDGESAFEPTFAIGEVFSGDGIDAAEVEDVICGCVQQYGEQMFNVGRNAWLQAGYPYTVPGITIDRRCGSGLQAVLYAAAAITDSGGIQEETTYLGIPCLTLRENTERPITVDEGTNRLVRAGNLATHVDQALSGHLKGRRPELWDGKAAQRCVDDLVRRSDADVPVASFLSGGLDSSSVVCVAQELFRETGESRQRALSARPGGLRAVLQALHGEFASSQPARV